MGEEGADEEAIVFTLGELRRLRDQIDQRVKQLETLLQGSHAEVKAPPAKTGVGPRRPATAPTARPAASEILGQFDELPWERARSKKCYWVRGDDVPLEIRNVLRRNGNELVVGRYRYVILDNENLLRFERNIV